MLTLRQRRLALYFSLFIAQIVVYTIVFHAIYPVLEGKAITLPQSLLFVMETITTVGYGDLLPFSSQITVIFSILVMVTGILNIFMFIPLLLEPYLTAIITPTPPQRLPVALEGHVILVGFGELAREVIENLQISDTEIVIVEESEEAAQEAVREYRDTAHVVWGSYADPRTWEHAGVRKAAITVVGGDERVSANVILGIRESARGRILAVVDDLAFDRYLRYAGADIVLSPKNFTGKILARHAAIGSRMDAVFDSLHAPFSVGNGQTSLLKLVKIPVSADSRAAGKTIRELALLERYAVYILAYWKNGRFVADPGVDDPIDSTTMLYALGRMDAVESLIREEFASEVQKQPLALIAGFGDVGRAAYQELASAGVSCVVVDRKKYTVNEIIGNAEDEEILRMANIEDAQICVVALNDDTVNIFTTLMARNLNPSLRILARANQPVSVDKLYRAGADYVALLPAIGGR